MNNETKVTPGSLAAAKAIIETGNLQLNLVGGKSVQACVLCKDDDGGDAELVAKIIEEKTGIVEMLAACRVWVAYFDRLARDDEPGDRLAVERNKFHGPRIEATRAAIAKAEGRAV